jgi:hypothetical protein
LISEKYVPGNPLAMFPAIKLFSHLPPHRFILDIAENINRFDQATQLASILIPPVINKLPISLSKGEKIAIIIACLFGSVLVPGP